MATYQLGRGSYPSEPDVMDSNHTGNALKGFLHFNDPATPERIKEVARKELGETEELKQKCLHELRKLIEENKLASITTDDFLLRFLRTRKFDVNRSFESLQNYARQRVAFHKRLSNLKPEVIEMCLRLNIFSFLPYRDSEERLILLITDDIWTPSICSDEDLATALVVLTNYAAEDPSSQVNGMVVINWRCIPLSVLPCFMRQIRFTMTFHFKNCLPVRYKSIHCIDDPLFFRTLLQLISTIMPKKIRDRMFLHGQSREVLFQHIPPSILPSEFGGNLGPLNSDHLIGKMPNYLQKLKDEQKYFFQENS